MKEYWKQIAGIANESGLPAHIQAELRAEMPKMSDGFLVEGYDYICEHCDSGTLFLLLKNEIVKRHLCRCCCYREKTDAEYICGTLDSPNAFDDIKDTDTCEAFEV